MMKLYYGTDDYNYKVLWKSENLQEDEEKVLLREMQMNDTCKRYSPIVCFFHTSERNGVYRYLMRITHASGEGRSKYFGQAYVDPIRCSEDYLDNDFLTNSFETIIEIQNKKNKNDFNEDVIRSVKSDITKLGDNDLRSILCWLIDNLDNKKVMRIILPPFVNDTSYISYDDRALGVIKQLYEVFPAELKQVVGCSTYWSGEREISEKIKIFITDEDNPSNAWFTFRLGGKEAYETKSEKTAEIVETLLSNEIINKGYMRKMADAYYSISHARANQRFSLKKVLLYNCHDFSCMQPILIKELNQYIIYLELDSNFRESCFYTEFNNYLNRYFNLSEYLKNVEGQLDKCENFTAWDNFEIYNMIEALHQILKSNLEMKLEEDEIEQRENDIVAQWINQKIYIPMKKMMTIEEQDKFLNQFEEDWRRKKEHSFEKETVESSLKKLRQEINDELQDNLLGQIIGMVSIAEYEILKEKIERGYNSVDTNRLINELNKKLQRLILNQIEELTETGKSVNIEKIINQHEDVLDVKILKQALEEKQKDLLTSLKRQTIQISSRKDLFNCISHLDSYSAENERMRLQIGYSEMTLTVDELRNVLQFLCDGTGTINVNSEVLESMLTARLLLPVHFSFAFQKANTEKLRTKVLDYFIKNEQFSISTKMLSSVLDASNKSNLRKELCSEKMVKRYSGTVYQDFIIQNFRYKKGTLTNVITLLVCCLLTIGLGVVGILISKEQEQPVMLNLLTDESSLEMLSSEKQEEIQSAVDVLEMYSNELMLNNTENTALEDTSQYLLEMQSNMLKGIRMQCILIIISVMFALSTIVGLINEKNKKGKINTNWMNLGLLLGSGIVIILTLLL